VRSLACFRLEIVYLKDIGLNLTCVVLSDSTLPSGPGLLLDVTPEGIDKFSFDPCKHMLIDGFYMFLL
jgi:hypothetical protein